MNEIELKCTVLIQRARSALEATAVCAYLNSLCGYLVIPPVSECPASSLCQIGEYIRCRIKHDFFLNTLKDFTHWMHHTNEPYLQHPGKVPTTKHIKQVSLVIKTTHKNPRSFCLKRGAQAIIPQPSVVPLLHLSVHPGRATHDQGHDPGASPPPQRWNVIIQLKRGAQAILPRHSKAFKPTD